MYAVIQTGGKQYRVAVGDQLNIEKLAVSVGDEIALDKVLMVSDGETLSIGKPLLENAKVKATVIGEGRGDKVHIFKMRRRKHYQRHGGHRQGYTELEIGALSA